MIIDFAQTEALQRYHLMTQTVIPRPIAWVLSLNDDQSLNLAPFSYFNAVCSDPPLLVLSIGKKTNGELKDTRINLLSGRDFVIHLAKVEHALEVTASSASLAYGDSEVTEDINLANFPGCPLPRLEDCAVAYHCKFYDVHKLGPNEQAIIYAEVKQLYLADNVVEQNNKRYTIDANKLNPLARLGGSNYSALGKTFSHSRPK